MKSLNNIDIRLRRLSAADVLPVDQALDPLEEVGSRHGHQADTRRHGPYQFLMCNRLALFQQTDDLSIDDGLKIGCHSIGQGDRIFFSQAGNDRKTDAFFGGMKIGTQLPSILSNLLTEGALIHAAKDALERHGAFRQLFKGGGGKGTVFLDPEEDAGLQRVH